MEQMSQLTSKQLDCLEQSIISARDSQDRTALDEIVEIVLPLQSKKAGLYKYCPHTPFAKQKTFLNLDCTEVFYGGAAAGGKSDSLLMAALEYVHVPGYSALILRKDYARLAMAKSIMDRAKEWLIDRTDAVWNGGNHRFTFPSGATITFGYIARPDDARRYYSAEFQFIGFDELTEFSLPSQDSEDNPYLILRSRLRKPVCMEHTGESDPECKTCNQVGALRNVPLRIRAASNPGGPAHDFVKARFITQESIDLMGQEDAPEVYYHPNDPQRAFIPARLSDNPFIDAEEYIDTSLSHLPPVLRARLINGDWTVIEDAIIKADWLRDYDLRGEILVPLKPDGTVLPQCQISQRECHRFATIDTAGTEIDKTQERRGRSPSWSVVQIWDYWHDKKFLFLRDIWRKRVGWEGLKSGIPPFLEQWNVKETLIENMHWGVPLSSEIHQKYGPKLISPQGKSKLVRSVPLQKMLESGEIYLPLSNNTWRVDLESEWLSWNAMPDQPADQVDTAAYAAVHVERGISSAIPWSFPERGRGIAKGW